MIAGPLTTRLLADLGAEVIKVESSNRVDRIREVGVQPPGLLTPDTNGVFNDCNTNKQSILLNLNLPAGIDLARRLVRTADIVTSNFTPDRMDRWGLGYEQLRKVKPDIIVASMPVMGTDGRRSHWRAVGNGVVAMAGLNAHMGFPDRPPSGPGTLHSDFTTPYFAGLQIAAALLHRRRTGEGQYIELAQYEASVHLLDTELVEYLVNGNVPPRPGNRSRHHAPHGVFPSRGTNRSIALTARSAEEWGALCHVLGLGQFASRPEFASVEGRREAETEIEAAISAATIDHDAAELATALQRAGVPASPVEDIGDLVERDPAGTELFTEIEHPSGVSMLLQHEAITWDGERLPIARAPLMGEHTASVYQRLLGIGADELAELVAEGVVG